MHKLILFAFLAAAHANAATTILTASGLLTSDDDREVFNFSIPTARVVTIRTWSFAGGTNGAGQVIDPGGFAPVLTLFVDPIGFTPPFVDIGGTAPSDCGLRNVDGATGFCLDGYLNVNLDAGSYTLVLTQYDNLALGNLLSDGFTQDGTGNFTGGPFRLNAGGGFQRTGEWALEIDGLEAVPEGVPEPSMLIPSALILTFAVIGRSRARQRKTV